MYWVNSWRNMCINDNEWTFKKCGVNKYCLMQGDRLNENEGFGLAVLLFIYLFILLTTILICIIIYKTYHKYHKLK